MSRTQQLDLTLSLAASATLQQDYALALACGRDERDRANALSAENATLRAALQAAQARIRDLERELRVADALAAHCCRWRVRVLRRPGRFRPG